MGLLSDFCGAVQGRMKRYGFDISTLLDTLLPMLVEMLEGCFDKSSDLESFASGKRTPKQMVGLRLRCRATVVELKDANGRQAIRGIGRIASATSDLQKAILDELEDRAGKATGPDIWQQALDEAAAF